MKIRTFHPADLDQILDLFYQTMHTIVIRDYTQEQIALFAPKNPDKDRWLKKLSAHYTFVAEKAEHILGFADLTSDGYLDHLYVHKDYQGQGIGSQLLKKIESQAQHLGLKTITTHASITAKPFFEKHGFIVLKKQTVTRNSIEFINYVMTKSL